ncbi:MAG: glycoside hydrolase, partial [Acidobacteria bacterium]|nr:glycoside hydrolase [Acidobacteriota bacterium]
FVIHTSVHQPLLDKKPGLSLGPFGQWFNRNETWAEQAQPWITYLARNCYLLQQGKFVADILYYYGEDTNLTDLFLHKAPEIPQGYNFDYINPDALIHVLTVADGQLATASGMRYRVLALDPHSQHMSLPVLRKLRDLVQAGAIVWGAKPTDTPSLADDENEFRHIVDQLWGSGEGETSGKGRVYGKQSLGETLATLHVGPDFGYTRPEPDTSLLFVHRKLSDSDLYFVDNRSDRFENLSATFRMEGKAAELWHADSGKIEPASYYTAEGRTTVPLYLAPWETVFVVFRSPAEAPSRTLPVVIETSLATIDAPWELSFPPGQGAPPTARFDKLTPWNDNADEGIKYFSGTATYTTAVDASGSWFRPGAQLWLDLGAVKNLAEVLVNGKSLGIVWKQPYRIDVTPALKPGTNSIQIKVTNGWANRIIGDRQPNAKQAYTFTSPKFYKATSPLWPSGLLGPVAIVETSVSAAR